jgi:hypothetical protein
MILPSEREAGCAGAASGGIAWWADRDRIVSAEWKSPEALKIPARRAEDTLRESAFSPFQAEPTHNRTCNRQRDSGQD